MSYLLGRLMPVWGAALVIASVGGAAASSELAAQDEPALVSQVEIRRTHYGVPHISADNLAALGFGLAYCQLEDYGARVVTGLIGARGELAKYFGPDSIDSDFQSRLTYRRALETYPLLSQNARDLYEGFARGINWYVELHPEEFLDWRPPRFAGHDVHARFILQPSQGTVRRFMRQFETEGSNAWAFAPSRTKSGNAILLRNPHLNWESGYYEAHLTIPGQLNFYGDVRIGRPLFYIGGFNDHLGWATTNNGADLDEIYALEVDPEQVDHYLFDGASVPIERKQVTVEFKNGNGLNTETREFWHTALGPVIHRGGGKIHVLRSSVDGEFRMVDQYLGMIRATNLEEWTAAMRMRAHPSSNFTYADRRGNIAYLWNAKLPSRPHPPGDTLATEARGSGDIWTQLVPFDALPRLANPRGGYIHNENDPFHYTNLNQLFDSTAYSTDFPSPELSLRSQLALQLIHETDGKLSLEDVIRAKHTTRMLLADRVKGDLVTAVRQSDPTDSVLQAISLIEQWDNTVSVESRGGVLFETWFVRYLLGEDSATGQNFTESWETAFAQPWTAERPNETPRGLADPERAAEAFAWAVDATRERFGSWDVMWGDVHRVRRGDVDVPVSGCSGRLGCFRVISYNDADDGKRAAASGDAWVLAVEFSNPPRAYSVLAYGQSARPESAHHSDQVAMFAAGTLKQVAFTEEQIEAQLIARYRPGRER